MTNSRSVLIIGPSNVPYTESGDDGRLANLLLAELRLLEPETDWRTAGVLLYQGPGMADRARRAVEACRPDVVILRLATYHLTHEYVLWKVRDRWPRLYPAARFIDARLKWLAGGAHDHANTPRPWVYALPRWLAQKVIGTSIGRSPEESVASVIGALDYLLSQEQAFLYLWRSSSVDTPKPRDKPEHERNFALFWDEVLAYARQHHLPQFSSEEMRRDFGVEKSRSVDGIHGSREYRGQQARFLALKAIEALRGEAVMLPRPEASPAHLASAAKPQR